MDIRWGILGCGDVCEKKAGPPLYQLPDSALLAVTRRDQDAGRSFATRHGPTRYVPTVDELLAIHEIDAIYVATPDAFHHAGTLAAAQAGKHVMVEKAMASNTRECDEMIDACARAGVVLAVAYYRRGYPSILKAKQLLLEGAIGSVRRLWINDQFPESHRIDLCHFLLGDIAEIRIHTEALWPDHIAASGPVLRCTHLSGAESGMGFGWQENHDVEKLVIDGDTGRIVIDDLKGGRVWLTRGNISETLHQPSLPFTHWGLFENMNAHLRDGTPLACDGIEGRKSTVILDTVNKAPHDNTPVSVTYE